MDTSVLKIAFAKDMKPQEKWRGIEVYLRCAEVLGDTPTLLQRRTETGEMFVLLKMSNLQFNEILKREDMIRARASVTTDFTREEAKELMEGGCGWYLEGAGTSIE